MSQSSIHRGSLRIPGYDYTQPGAYFLTICTRKRKPIFGYVLNGVMHLSGEGEIARYEWERTQTLRCYVHLDQYVIMPDHFHGILQLLPQDNKVPPEGPRIERFGGPVKGSLGSIIRSYKSAVTYWVNRMWDAKGASIWQRNYYERVIRNQEHLERVRKYILENPMRWEKHR